MSHPRSTLLLALLLGACRPGGVVLDEEIDGTVDVGDTGQIRAGALEISPATIDLGVVFVGQSVDTALTLTNVGEEAAQGSLSLVGAAADSFSIAPDSASLTPGASSEHLLSFAPQSWASLVELQVVVVDLGTGDEASVPVVAVVQEDSDGDGVGSVETGGEDCDDHNSTVLPGAEDAWYDGIDSDCAGNDDYDQDGDGSPIGEGADCDDTDASIHPGADDTWYDGIDSDCAGNDDYDQDGDGYRFDEDDCDDTDATMYPGAEDTWYDGFDSDCAGNDDYDQDGDGHQSQDYAPDGVQGDDCDDENPDINPSVEETWYDGIDSDCAGDDDYDQDGDGYLVDEDCDDTDAALGLPTDETLDGTDEDCNGLVDDLSIDDAASGWLFGYSSSMQVGDKGSMGMVGDITGDGAVDLLIAADNSSSGYAWVVDGAAAAAAYDDLNDVDTALLVGSSSSYALSSVISPAGDQDGDGTVDLLIAGGSNYFGRAYLLDGGSGISGSLDMDGDYDVRFEGDSDYDALDRAAMGDIDGDGIDDIVTGARLQNYGGSWSGDTDTGSIAFFQGGTLSGRLDLDSADDEIFGESEYDYLGSNLVLADLDDDGYVDVIAAAPGDDDTASRAGAVYIFSGDSSLSFSTRADDAQTTKIVGAGSNDQLGEDALPTPGDVDGDGDLDILIPLEDQGDAWLFLDAGSLGSSVTVGDADHAFSGSAGDYATSAVIDSDLDGDGADEVALGGDSEDYSSSNSGVVYIYRFDSSWGSSLGAGDANATIWGASSDDLLGSGMAGGADLDGDGLEDLIIGAIGVDTGASGGGAIYILPGW